MGRAHKPETSRLRSVWRQCPPRADGAGYHTGADGRTGGSERSYGAENRGRRDQHLTDHCATVFSRVDLPLGATDADQEPPGFLASGTRDSALARLAVEMRNEGRTDYSRKITPAPASASPQRAGWISSRPRRASPCGVPAGPPHCKRRLKSAAGGTEWCGGRKVRHLQINHGGCSPICSNGPRYAAEF